MEVCLEALLELGFCTKPPNFGVEAYIEAPTGVALIPHLKRMFANPSTAKLMRWQGEERLVTHMYQQ
jgi:hypothetical protein